MSENISSVIKCNSCGADMTYSPEKGMMYCSYCDSSKEIEKIVPKSRDFLTEKSEGAVDDTAIQYKCPNCGGEIELENFQTAKQCPFCGATNIVQTENIKGMKPDSILPFTYSREMAYEAGKKWMKKRIFAPRKLRKNFNPKNFNGVYVPTFLFDTDTASTYEGVLGERRTRTVGSGDNKRVETYIHWFPVSGNCSQCFKDLVIEASKQITQKEIKKLEPFDTVAIEGYKKRISCRFFFRKV